MEYKVGDLIIGKVTSVKPYALFLEFPNNLKGLLHISELSDSYIRDIEKFGVPGDEMKVIILSIDNDNSFLRVSLKKVPLEDRYTVHNDNLKEGLSFGEEDFKPLKDRLPEWINNTLKKARGEN